MSAAQTALRQFERDPRDENARNDYNFAVARIIATVRDEKLDPWTQPLRVPGSGMLLTKFKRQWHPFMIAGVMPCPQRPGLFPWQVDKGARRALDLLQATIQRC